MSEIKKKAFDNNNISGVFDINIHSRISTGLPECENEDWKVLREFAEDGHPCNILHYKRNKGSRIMVDHYHWGYDRFLIYLTKFGNSISKIHMSGLGIGMLIPVILSHRNIEKLNVVEVSCSLIDLIEPFYESYTSSGRLKIQCFDAMKWDPDEGEHYDVAFHDIWYELNKEESISMLKRYIGFCDKQFCWCGT